MKLRSHIAASVVAILFAGNVQAGVIPIGAAPKITGMSWSSFLYGGLVDVNGGRAYIYNPASADGSDNLLGTISLQGGSPTPNPANNPAGTQPGGSSGGGGGGGGAGGGGGGGGTGPSGSAPNGSGPNGTGPSDLPDLGGPSGGNPPEWQNEGPKDHPGAITGPSLPQQDEPGGGEANEVPEPASLALFGLGLAAAGVMRRRVKGGTR